MSVTGTAVQSEAEAGRRHAGAEFVGRRAARHRRWRWQLPRTLIGSALIFLVWAVATLLVPAIANRSAEDVIYGTKLLAPGFGYPLGTDALGRDVLVRIAVAFRYDLIIGVASVFAAAVIGLLIGALAGSGAEWLDNLTMGVLDVVSVFPGFVLALIVAAAAGASVITVIVAIAIVLIPHHARGMRAAILAERVKPYAEAARAMALPYSRIVLVHLLPNCLGPTLTMASMDIATAIMIAAGLSYIGFGVQPPTPEWGLMINEGSSYIVSGQWWVTFFPGLAILSVVVAFFMLDQGLKQLRRRR
ncbi:MAG: ABC transporter permease [Chloroflexota bacterium]